MDELVRSMRSYRFIIYVSDQVIQQRYGSWNGNAFRIKAVALEKLNIPTHLSVFGHDNAKSNKLGARFVEQRKRKLKGLTFIFTFDER